MMHVKRHWKKEQWRVLHGVRFGNPVFMQD